MEANTLAQKYYSFEEYLALEQSTQIRHLYYQGGVFAMAGGTKRHNTIARNVAFTLNQQKPACETFINDVKLELQAKAYYVYPGVMLTCDAEDLSNDRESIVKNPSLVIEVLSESTAAYDEQEKKRSYFKLPTLLYYMLISQEKPMVEVYERANQFWKYTVYENLTDTIQLDKLDVKLSLLEIYKKINFEKDTAG